MGCGRAVGVGLSEEGVFESMTQPGGDAGMRRQETQGRKLPRRGDLGLCVWRGRAVYSPDTLWAPDWCQVLFSVEE